MCPSGCWMLYDGETPLKDISCPCGHGYWDVLQAQFVHGTEVRQGKAESKAKYEKRLLETIPDPAERDARLRAQLIAHFLGCVHQRATEKDSKQESYSIRRATAELQDVLRGDYHSRGGDEQAQLQGRGLSDIARRPDSPSVRNAALFQGRRSGEIAKDRHQTVWSAAQSHEMPGDEDDGDEARLSIRPRRTSALSDVRRSILERSAYPSSITNSSNYTYSERSSALPSGRSTSGRTYSTSPAGPTIEIKNRDEAEYSTNPSRHTTESRPTTRREPPDRDAERRPAVSGLLTKFVQFDEAQYASIATFCRNNIDIFHEDFQRLQLMARQQLEQENTLSARRILHRLVILQKCSKMTTKERDRYIKTLSSSKEDQNDVEEMVDRIKLLLKPTQ